ncbi:hypothetical protein Tco_0465040 [Tanacetum coccineum]
MKEAIRMVLESIYDPEFPDTSHFRSGRGCHSALRRIKEEWGTSRWFLEFDIRKCFHTIDRHRLIPIFKEEIGDPKFFYPIQKVFSAGRLVGAEKGPYSVPHSVLLSALPDNIYLHKLDQEIGRIQQKYEIPICKEILKIMKNQIPSFYFWCMSTQFSSNQIKLHFPNPEKSLQFRQVEESESDNLFHDHIQGEDENAEDIQMADHLRPMEELLQIPIIGIEDSIVVPAVLANEFELKIELLDFISNNPFFGLENDDPHSHIKRFYQIARTFKINQMPHDGGEVDIIPMAEALQESPLGVLPSNTVTDPCTELKAITTMDGLTLDNPTRRVNHFVYRIDIVDSLCDKFPIKNNSLSGNPTPSSDSVVESLSPLPTPFGDSDSLLEETDTLLSHFDDSLPDYETFCFDTEEKSSGSTTSHFEHSLPDYEAFCFDVDHIKEKSSGSTISKSDHSLLDYEAFCFDHIEEKSSGSTTSHSNHSLAEYESFHFNLSIDPLPPIDRKLTILLEENISEDSTKELTSPELNDLRLLLPDCDSTFSKEFSKIDLLVSFPSGNKDKIFDPGIFIIKGVQSLRFHILLLNEFSTISFVTDSLLLTNPSEIKTFLSFPFGNEDKVSNPGILISKGVHSLTLVLSHRNYEAFKTVNVYPNILNESPMKIFPFYCFFYGRDGNGYSRKGAKRKPKASNSKHGVEEGKVKSHQNEENTT